MSSSHDKKKVHVDDGKTTTDTWGAEVISAKDWSHLQAIFKKQSSPSIDELSNWMASDPDVKRSLERLFSTWGTVVTAEASGDKDYETRYTRAKVQLGMKEKELRETKRQLEEMTKNLEKKEKTTERLRTELGVSQSLLVQQSVISDEALSRLGDLRSRFDAVQSVLSGVQSPESQIGQLIALTQQAEAMQIQRESGRTAARQIPSLTRRQDMENRLHESALRGRGRGRRGG